MSDFTSRFSGKTADYIKYRPKYPSDLLTLLKTEIGLNPGFKVADIGSGTGISTLVFTENGNTVYAVEPNTDMRKAAEQIFEGNSHFISINGSAESTGLENGSIDLIFSGTAFHWFDLSKTKKEFIRILKTGGTVVISWISRDISDKLQQETEDIYNKYTEDIEAVENQKQRESVEKFFAPQMVEYRRFLHSQPFTEDEYLGRLRSSSFFPDVSHKDYTAMSDDFREVFRKYQKNGIVDFKYITEVYWGKLND